MLTSINICEAVNQYAAAKGFILEPDNDHLSGLIDTKTLTNNKPRSGYIACSSKSPTHTKDATCCFQEYYLFDLTEGSFMICRKFTIPCLQQKGGFGPLLLTSSSTWVGATTAHCLSLSNCGASDAFLPLPSHLDIIFTNARSIDGEKMDLMNPTARSWYLAAMTSGVAVSLAMVQEMVSISCELLGAKIASIWVSYFDFTVPLPD